MEWRGGGRQAPTVDANKGGRAGGRVRIARKDEKWRPREAASRQAQSIGAH